MFLLIDGDGVGGIRVGGERQMNGVGWQVVDKKLGPFDNGNALGI